MKASVEEVNPVQRRIKVELDEADVNRAFAAVYKKIQKKAQIRGFRPGKAPMSVLKKFYGSSAAVDVVDDLVRKHLFEAIEEKSINPIATPVLETAELPKEDAVYEFSALVDILPPVTVDGYKGLKLDYSPMALDSAAVDRELEVIQRNQSKRQELSADAAAEKGNIASISQTATLNGESFEPFKLDEMPIELGRGFIVPEFDEALYGLKVGDSKDIEVTIPDTFQDKDLIGKSLTCHVTVKKLESVVLPELNDELAKDVGAESLEKLKENIQQSLERQSEQHKRQQLEASLFEQLGEKNQFEIPPSMVDQVIDGMFDEMNFQTDAERASAKKDPEQRKSMRDTAKTRAKNSLMLSELIKAESIEVTDADIDAYIAKMLAGNTNGDLDPKILESLKASFAGQAKETVLFQKAIDFIIDHAEVSEKA